MPLPHARKVRSLCQVTPGLSFLLSPPSYPSRRTKGLFPSSFFPPSWAFFPPTQLYWAEGFFQALSQCCRSGSDGSWVQLQNTYRLNRLLVSVCSFVVHRLLSPRTLIYF